MNARQSPEEARDAKIADLTETIFRARLSNLAQPAVLREVGCSVLDYLVHAECLHKLTLGEVTFVEVRDRVMRDEAEADAIKAVEQMERQRAESAAEGRVERATWALSLN